MATFVSDLEPRPLWRHFDKILATPRPSKKEGALRDAIRAWATARGLPSRIDPAVLQEERLLSTRLDGEPFPDAIGPGGTHR